MAAQPEGGNKEFLDFLKRAPTLDEANADDATELTGVVNRGAEGKFAITTGDGQTYELEAAAVQRFRVEESQGLSQVVTVRISAEALKNAVLRPIKPIFKDIGKDPIKDIIHDHGTLHGKDFRTDPIVDKPIHKDIRTDPIQDKNPHKDFATDPIVDKKPFKDIHKDPLQDPLDTGWADVAGKPAGDPVDFPDPAGGLVNPAAAAGGATPFVMQTPHHAASHLVAQQMGAPYATAALGGAQLKAARYDTIKEVAYAETVKEPVTDTRKEMVFDTHKEMVWDTWVEGGPHTMQEGVFDPGQVVVQPEWGAGLGAAAGGFRQF